ncbi:hypothetical protein M404DRAFT_118482 [Pisolithus tinctorius Marx 270]|uniref:Uncharacterized protein n=1 Tax=Pisolithus tinctorius Marx 270 TaxID=870435 RepID=A0A0C3JZW1_PISTI|nr:hypothetical protein M404DRAFT_118482 [Pisolithus tinctorius Marx 270]
MPWWQGGPAQYDCILVDNGSSENDPLCGLLVAHCLLFFSFKFQGHSHSCVLVKWFPPFGDALDPLTGMWVIVPEVNAAGHHVQAVISIKSILQGIHLIECLVQIFYPLHFTSCNLSMHLMHTMSTGI